MGKSTTSFLSSHRVEVGIRPSTCFPLCRRSARNAWLVVISPTKESSRSHKEKRPGSVNGIEKVFFSCKIFYMELLLTCVVRVIDLLLVFILPLWEYVLPILELVHVSCDRILTVDIK